MTCGDHSRRSVSRYCDDGDEYRETGTKLLSLMETTLAGTVYVYQGQELGMRNVPTEWEPEEYKDIETINYWKKYAALPLSLHPVPRLSPITPPCYQVKAPLTS